MGVSKDGWNPRGARATGSLELVLENPLGAAELKKQLDSIFPTIPVLPIVTGTYVSQCPLEKYIQIEAAKFSRNDPFNLRPLNGYEFSGRFGTDVDADHSDSIPPWLKNDGKFQLRGAFNDQDILYDFYRDVLELRGLFRKSCSIEKDGIVCGSCRYARNPKDIPFLSHLVKNDFSRNSYPIKFDNSLKDSIKETDMVRDVEGSYFGVLHFEQRDRVLPLSVDIDFSGIPTSNNASMREQIGNRPMSLRSETLFIHPSPDGRFSVDFSLPMFLESVPFHSGSGRLLSGKRGDTLHILHQTKETIYGVAYNTELDGSAGS